MRDVAREQGNEGSPDDVGTHSADAMDAAELADEAAFSALLDAAE